MSTREPLEALLDAEVKEIIADVLGGTHSILPRSLEHTRSVVKDRIKKLLQALAASAEREPLGPCICPPGHIGHMDACPAGYMKPLRPAEPASTPALDDEDVLKPCPFCGGAPEMRHIDEGENAGADFIECIQCQASTNLQFSLKDDGRPALRERWNRRAQPAPQSVEEQARTICEATKAVPIDHRKGDNCPRCDAIEAALARITPKEKP